MAAEKIQQYYRRWRGRTIFQQLQRYRAAKHHDLVIFSHQVHIYGQEFFQYLSRNKAPLPLDSVAAVDRETARNTTDSRMKMLRAVRKLPISRSLGDFFDTTEMCAPHHPNAVGRAGRSRTPERSASPQASSPQPCPSCQGAAAAAVAAAGATSASGAGPSPDPRQPSPDPRQLTPDPRQPTPDPRYATLEPGVRSGAVSPQFEFELPSCSSATVSETRAVFDRRTGESRPPAPTFSAPTTPSYPGHASTYQTTPTPHYQSPNPSHQTPTPSYQTPTPSHQTPTQSYQTPTPSYQSPTPSYQSPTPSYQTPAPSYPAPAPAPSYAAPPAPSYNRFGGSSYSSAAQGTASAATSGGGSMWGKRWATTAPVPAAFVQELQDRGGRTDEEDAPPFNFQGMLRKTNAARDSMKRGEPGSGQPNNTLPTNVVIASYGASAPTGYSSKKLRNRSTDDQPSPVAPAANHGGGSAVMEPQTSADTGPARNNELEPPPSHNGSNGDLGRGTETPQIVFEGEEVDL